MTTRTTLGLLMGAGLALLTGCGSTARPPPDAGSDAGPEAVPDDYWGLASDLPAGAQLISGEAFDARVDAGSLIEWNGHTRKVAEAAAALQEARDDETLADLLVQRPELAHVVVDDPPDDPNLVRLPDGNDELTLDLGGGVTTRVTTMGRRWRKHAVAESLRRVPTYEGQLVIYRRLYALLDATQRRTLGLVDPAIVETQPQTYDLNAIAGLIGQIRGGVDGIISSVPPDPPPSSNSFDCGLDLGTGSGSDRYTDTQNPGLCDPRDPNGLFEKLDFKGKWYLTCVKDQFRRGTCTAFAATGAIEYWVAKRYGLYVNLSEQALYNRYKLVWDPQVYPDGAYSIVVFGGMTSENWLMPLENQWEYNPSPQRVDDEVHHQYTASCVGYADTCSDAAHQSDMFCTNNAGKLKCGYDVPNKNPNHQGYRITGAAAIWNPLDPQQSLTTMRLFLAFGYPVIIGHPVTPDLELAQKFNGWMHYDPDSYLCKGGHALLAVASIDNFTLATLLPDAPPGAGGGYLILKNSWSTCFADGGYVYMPWQSMIDRGYEATVLYGVQ